MLYYCLRFVIRIALQLFCSRLLVHHQTLTKTKGPLLITANHPNSFLDAIIIGALFQQPVHFLARGDAFKKPWHRWLLEQLHMIPIYRISEGRQYLHLNNYSFNRSYEILAAGGIVLIFIEGICVNQHQLQPFKKGAARIALRCWDNGIPLQVMPVGISYDSFKEFNKTVVLDVAPPLSKAALTIDGDAVKSMHQFNTIIKTQLKALIHPPIPTKTQHHVLLLAMGWLGWLLHRPFYYPIQQWVASITPKTVFFDSVLFGVLLILYPLYLCLLVFLLSYSSLSSIWIVAIAALHPITAWIAVRYSHK